MYMYIPVLSRLLYYTLYGQTFWYHNSLIKLYFRVKLDPSHVHCSDIYMGIKHENTEQMSAEYFHHRDTLALFITLST